jgi:peptide/nickel transport system permease protein
MPKPLPFLEVRMSEKTYQNEIATADETAPTMGTVALPRTGTVVLKRKRVFPKTGALVVIALVILTVVVGAAILADMVAPLKRSGLTFRDKLKPPVWMEGSDPRFFLGTNGSGHDILAYLVHGARTSLVIGVAVATFAGLVGVLLGLLAGFKGKWFDTIIMRWVDVQIAFPFIVLAIVVGAIFRPSMLSLIAILTIAGWPFFARVTRGEVLAVKARDYVVAATAIGSTGSRIALRHVLPNIISSIIVYWTFLVGIIIIAEASISFLGLGLPQPAVSWGSMINDGRNYLESAWWVPFWPSLVLTLVVVSINTVGDWLRDILDPTTSRR